MDLELLVIKKARFQLFLHLKTSITKLVIGFMKKICIKNLKF